MIDALIKRVYVTYKCYEMYAHRGKSYNCSCFESDQEMDAILLIIDIIYEFVESSLNQYSNALISYFLLICF
jgi:hypothetical protein